MTTDQLNAYIQALMAEHQELRREVRAVERALDQAVAEDWDVRQSTALARQVEELLRHLTNHCAQEEEGGYLEEALAHAPWFHVQVARIVAQHALLLQELTELSVELRRVAPRDGADFKRLDQQLREVLRRVLTHEHTENEILERAYNIDLEL